MDDGGVLESVAAWAAAELSGDPEAIGETLTDEFIGVGPLGFLLSRQDWLDRHASGALRYTEFALTDQQVRVYGEKTSLVIGRLAADGSYQGHPVPTQLRATLMLVGSRLAGIHMSFIAGTPGAPPIPGSSR